MESGLSSPRRNGERLTATLMGNDARSTKGQASFLLDMHNRFEQGHNILKNRGLAAGFGVCDSSA